MVSQQQPVTAPMGIKRRNGSNMPLNVRTKSQNSSSTASGVKDVKIQQKSKEEMDKWKKHNERKKTERFDNNLHSINEDFQRRCKKHLQQTVDECDHENAANP